METGNQEVQGESNMMQASSVTDHVDHEGGGSSEVVHVEQGHVGEQNSAPKEEVLKHSSFNLFCLPHSCGDFVLEKIVFEHENHGL